MRCKTRRRFKATTHSKHTLLVAPNQLDRQFIVNKPDQAYIGDITYLHTQQGWLYLAVVIELYSRQVVAWSMAEHMRATLVNNALLMAVWKRKPKKGLLWHTDRGSQYASHSHRKLLKQHGIQQSMSRKGNCWDTQYKIPLNVRPNLTRAGIGVIAFVLTCRLVTGVLRYSPDLLLVT